MTACSRSRKAASPWRAKISAMVAPASASITSSTSTNLQPRRAARSGPTVRLARAHEAGENDAAGWGFGFGLGVRSWKASCGYSSRVRSFQYREYALPGVAAGQPSAITTAPAVMSRPPMRAGGGELFAQQQPGEDDDQRDAELVERRDARGRAQLQGAEVAEPREAGGQAGEREKEHGAAVERRESPPCRRRRARPARRRCPRQRPPPRWCAAPWPGSSPHAPRPPWPAGRWRRQRRRRALPIQSSSWGIWYAAGRQCARIAGVALHSNCMETGKASKTALRVAIRRAAHQLMDQPPVLDDPIAVRLVGSGYRGKMERATHRVARDFRAFMAVRSRYVEDRLAEAVAQGITQYVVLGAGLDTFAYRNPFPCAAGLRGGLSRHAGVEARDAGRGRHRRARQR